MLELSKSIKLLIYLFLFIFGTICVVYFIAKPSNALVIYPPGGISQCPYGYELNPKSPNMCIWNNGVYDDYNNHGYNTNNLHVYDPKNPCSTKSDIINKMKLKPKSNGFLWDGVISGTKFSYIFDKCCATDDKGNVIKVESKDCKPFFKSS